MLIAAASTSFITAAIITAMPFIHVRGTAQQRTYRLILDWKLQCSSAISLWMSDIRGVDSRRSTKLDYAAHSVTAFHL